MWQWNSQPALKFGMQGGDFMLSMNILLSGNNYRKVALLFEFMNMGMVAEGTHFRLQDAYCIEPIQEYWEKTRAEVLECLGQKDHVVVLGQFSLDCIYIFVKSYNLSNSSGNFGSNILYLCLLHLLGDGRMDSPGKFCNGILYILVMSISTV